jgi:hypothetical protein
MILTANERKELDLLLEGTEWVGRELTERAHDGSPYDLPEDMSKGFPSPTAYYISYDQHRDIYGTQTEVREYLAMWTLCQMPGCCGACVSTGAFVARDVRNRGLGTFFNKVRQRLAREAGYGIMICTDIESNEPQQKVLDRTGWESVYKWINPRTKNALEMRVVHLADV